MTAVTLASPYRGLAAFGESDVDAQLFFGRARETEIVAASLLASRLTVLYGPSGAGKSSLLRAGVSRRIRELGARNAAVRGPDLVVVVFSRWTEHPADAVAAAVADALRPLVSPTTPQPPSDARLVDVVEHWSAALDGEVCLVLDQFEELFVYHDDTAGFLDELASLVLAQHVRANVLLALREDELARLDGLKARLPNVFANTRRLDRLDRASARSAVLGPLDWWNASVGPARAVDIEADLVESILDQTAVGDRVEAPYLQLVLERMWDVEGAEGSRVLRLSTLASLGGAAAIVRDHLESALGGLDERSQQAAARMFEHLITPSGTKVAHRASDLERFAQGGADVSRQLLDALDRRRILRRLDDAAGGRRYEIFHDVLAEPIVDWTARRELETERSQAAARHRRLRLVAGASLAVAILMVAIAAYALAQRSDARTQARRARGAALAAAALAQLPRDPEVALRLARAAAVADPSGGVENVLRSTLQGSRAVAVLGGGVRPVLATGFDASGSHVETIDAGGSLRVYDRRSGRPTTTRRFGGRIRGAAFAPSGAAVAVAARRLVQVQALAPTARSFGFRVPSPVRALAIDGRGDRAAVTTLDGHVLVRAALGVPRVLDAGTKQSSVALDEGGTTVASAAGHRVRTWVHGKRAARFDTPADVASIAVAPDGSIVATAGTDGGMRIWRVSDGSLVATALATTQLTSVAFSRDGGAVVAGGADGVTHVFTAATGKELPVLARHADAVTAVAISPSAALVATGARDGGARVWSSGVAPDMRRVVEPARCCTAFASSSYGAYVGAGGDVLAIGSRATLVRQRSRVTALDTDGATLVVGGADGGVRRGATLVLRMRAPLAAVAVRDGVVAGATAAGAVEISAHGHVIAFHEHAAVAGLALSPDTRLLATAGVDGVARLRDAETGRLLRELKGHTKPLTAVAFSPDGSLVATASYDKDVRVWNTSTAVQTRLLRGHFGVVSDVAFSPDGRWLVTAGPSAVGLFGAATGVGVAFLRGPTARVTGAGFAGDRDVYATTSNGVAWRYRCDICGSLPALVALADDRIAATGGDLTAAQEREYLIR